VELVVCFIEVVVALGVADAVDCCFSHGRGCWDGRVWRGR
jgi:hypothetical protein